MNLSVPKNSGFCPGNRFAELSLLQLKKDKPGRPVCLMGELLHNRQYLEYLGDLGFIRLGTDELPGPDSIAVIGTHGIDKKKELVLRAKMEVLDLTCSKIKRLQNYVAYYSENGYFVVITGEKDHPEVKGLLSHAYDHTLIEDDEDLEVFMDDYRADRGVIAKKGYCKILVVTQTTGCSALFGRTAKIIQEQCGRACEVKILDSLCSYNTLREEEALRLQGDTDLTVLVGDELSSNTLRLKEALQKKDGELITVRNREELEKVSPDPAKYGKVLVVASSSTPVKMENEVIQYLKNL